MPRRTRSKSRERILRSSGESTEEIDLDPVVNVNKRRKVPKKRTNGNDSEQNYDKDLNQKLNKGKNKGNKQRSKSGDRIIQTSFVENGHLIQMGVEEGEDEFYTSSDEVVSKQKGSRKERTKTDEPEEGEISSEEDSEAEITFNKSAAGDRENKEISTNSASEEVVSMETESSESRSDQIKRIDKEMKERILELKKLMQEGGLEESAALLATFPQMEEKEKGQEKNKKGMENSSFIVDRQNENRNENANVGRLIKERTDNNINKLPMSCSNSRSMETIYEAAVPQRDNSSSEEELLINSSDDSANMETAMETDLNEGRDIIDKSNSQVPSDKQIEVFISETRRAANEEQKQVRSRIATREEMGLEEQPQPSTSRYIEPQRTDITPEQRIRDMIRAAEKSKARIFSTPGNNQSQFISHERMPNNYIENADQVGNFVTPTAIVDEGYIVVGAHLDETMVSKISKGDYVDFGKLLPKDRVTSDDEGRMELVHRNGKTFWAPVSASVNINGFAKWEQAFRVYSNIYCKANPHRSAELIEYNHIIHTVALAYIWDNVYTYDREFRLHMARNPQRSWAMILQQAWSLRLRDRIMSSNTWANSNYNAGHTAGNFQRTGNNRISEPCRRYNRGKCNFGNTCKFEHRCSYCFKFGHSSVNCRKAIADRERRNSNGNNQGQSTHHNQTQNGNNQSAHIAQESQDRGNNNQSNNKKN